MRNVSVGSVYGCWKTDFRATVDIVSTKTANYVLSDSTKLMAAEICKSS